MCPMYVCVRLWVSHFRGLRSWTLDMFAGRTLRPSPLYRNRWSVIYGWGNAHNLVQYRRYKNQLKYHNDYVNACVKLLRP